MGVEEGPEAILTDEFLKSFKKHKCDKFDFPKPEDINKNDYVDALINSLEEFKNFINSKLKNGQTQVIIGGENSVTFSSLLALLERVETIENVGYIQFDSHGEMNSFRGSESKNFHGMYMRPFFDGFDIPQIDNLIPCKLKSNQALFIGDLDLDGDEPQFFAKKGFRNITRGEMLTNKEKMLTEVRQFITNYEYIHVNFDIDIFDKSIAGATGIPDDGKWMKEEVFGLLAVISKHQNFSFDLMEVNPKKPNSERTVNLARAILNFVLT